ncbi:undecaprenyl-phosphate glucose phosphotransferase [Methylobacterium radiodurans]|uniref:Undecaprenyl-phosphate glucose phosphotransferase n=1 Tax=Methylobacterium radiodurans TaxID=2202828 RepID=A0A2U8VXN9_9HYPH|nr:undecaprenyl-phosphate glucose phosphotransferase [Methylobacterium radiodurans]AWN37896.1 undecaprenyl-phosphate glucose phosphotransferase [Methylobacterium radiodurans]
MFQDRPPQIYRALPSPGTRRNVWAALMPRRRRALARLGVPLTAACIDLAVIVGTTLLLEYVYAYATEAGVPASSQLRAWRLAGLLALVVLSVNVLRGSYTIETLLDRRPHLQRTASLWLAAWGAVLVVSFVTKTTTDFSRAVAAGTVLLGLPALMAGRALTVWLVRRLARPGSHSVARVHLVGYEEDVARFYAGNRADALGLRVIGTSYLRRPDADLAARQAQMDEDLELAVSVVRFLRPDDVFILVPWSEPGEVERCIDAFLRVPAALHLRPGTVLDRFPDMQVARVGRLSGINIGRRPLNLAEVALKRAFDLAVSLIALALLAPLLAAVAVLIKLDSPGPVLFRQKRYGFNQQPFWVFKFRSMRAEADAPFRQATRNDARVTRVGAFLRRSNLDELPQLLNVVKGEMSLVGPRPHALAHDRSFERRIALYARRHNVRPGITGWAQVNGLRGETLTDADMEARVAHDLHYIDNWSLWFDLQIILRTVVSRQAYDNAF